MSTFPPSQRRRQRGVSLIEALMAFAVMALGMLGVMGVQTTLRFNSDIAKQRSEATRLAQEQMESLRAFSVLAPAEGHVAYDDIATVPSAAVQGYTTNTTYSLVTEVAQSGESKNVTVSVAWADRQGGQQLVVLNSVIAGIDPGLSGTLSLPPNGSPQKAPRGRHAGIPFDAIPLRSSPESAFAPPGSSGVVWVFNNVSGLVTRVCTSMVVLNGLAIVSQNDCQAAAGLVVSGAVRFDTDGRVSAAEAENPVGSLALDLNMALPVSGASVDCFDDAPTVPTSATAVHYNCLVNPAGNSGRWSGTLNVVLAGDRTLGPAADQFRICRYSADYDNRGGIENLEHPLVYTDVTGPLTNQNFLVIRGDNTCPSDGAANPAQGDFVNSNTVEHAPNPA
jgi:Tfp pilus assembly protein PilV